MELQVVILLGLVSCGYCKLIDLSCKQIRGFVDGHNSRRLQLVKGEVPGQPPAAEMKYMVWDHELANKAAKWASRNMFAHNPDRTVGSGRFLVGENIHIYSTSDQKYKFDIDSAMESWFSEHKDYEFSPLTNGDFSRSDGVQIGHYTQMAWSDSTHVGCGVSQYTKNGWFNYLVVCNYGPTGNYLGQTPYNVGPASGHLICEISDCRQPYGDKC